MADRFSTGCTNNYGIDSFEGRNHTLGRLGWYKSDLFLGNHDFKAGFDYAAAHADRKISSRDGSKNAATGLPTGPVGNYQLVYRTPPGATGLAVHRTSATLAASALWVE